MTIVALADEIGALPHSGITSDEQAQDRMFWYSLIDSAAAMAKRNDYAVTKKIHNAWYFPLFIELDPAQQIDDCYYRFDLPQVIQLSPTQTGLGYVGTIKFNQGFRVTIGRAAFSSQQADRYMKVIHNKTDVLVDNDSIEVYGKKPQKLRIDGMWAEVTKLPNFNVETDNYPITEDLIPQIKKIITQTDLLVLTKSFVDRMQNKVDDSAITQTR